ncbi:helix-turn-helix domain-containing protein [Enterococcus sp. BWR-S5]|uniref:helix-turn-helix domain-containing protein n=1 Tax=Enterococcus sp. BWR-S5 TaxID=2787714 RepID=UPI00192045E4|nr:helix-turn-helix transcriptional regulator [Enterococcus sp. BWR-S5]MBL1227529.1 helix-turn-helix transcriptional regulator [Enterococcus sp. BWR-S5]
MELPLLLKTIRIKNNFTQQQLAEKIFVTHQTISKWETGINMPSIDNLLMLSDLYDISLDELIRGSTYFKKPFIVGHRATSIKIMGVIALWLLISLLFTGFGYQPVWLFLLVFFLGLVVVLPTVIKDYWVIEKKGIKICQYPKQSMKRTKHILQSLFGRKPACIFLPYQEIISVELIYRSKVRYSPFDVQPDIFVIRVEKIIGEPIILPLSTAFVAYIPQAMSYIERKGITIVDSANLIGAIINKEYLFDYMNRTE